MRTVILVTAAAVAACADLPPSAPVSEGARTAIVRVMPGLVQTVRFEPGQPHTGDTVRIHAVLQNTGPMPTPPIETSICGLGLRGTLTLEHPSVQCAGYSMTAALGPGEAVTDDATRIVRSAPGTYRLEVQHLRSAAGWVPLTVVVR